MTEYHQPVLLRESVDGLNIKSNGIYVDVTFGGGGHSREILKKLDKGKLLAFDQDEDALNNIFDDERFLFAHHNFRFLSNFLKHYGIEKIDGLLADLGVSSHHFDLAERGFSFRFDASVDMRMNRQSRLSAKEILNAYEYKDLARILREYGELKNASKVAGAITAYRENTTIDQTRDLLEALSNCIPRQGEHQFLAKVYQAIRIEVNKEIENLKQMLEQARDCLKPGGRLVIISYHSLEDRVVKDFIRNGSFEKEREFDLYGTRENIFKAINKKIIVPGEEELKINNRSRSAKLRIAEKR